MRTTNQAGYRIQFHPATPHQVYVALLEARDAGVRIRIQYQHGHSESGYVGCSTGTSPILLLRNNSRSLGGTELLTLCILEIRESSGKKRTLYGAK